MKSSAAIGRRSFFARTGALAAVAGSLEQLSAAQNRPGARPKNIIFMVSDGMSPTVLTLAEHFSLLVRQKGTMWHALYNRPDVARGLMDMASLNSIVTDSSAASSSWGSGSRIWNGMVNVLPDGTALTPIASIAQQQKKRVGLVTTATVTHATPAGFAASTNDRGGENIIAEQYYNNVDVILGGGRTFFDADKRKDGKDVPAEYARRGYTLVRNKQQLFAAHQAPKMLGLFSNSHVPYTIDHRQSEELQREVPTLAEMTEVALNSLSQSSDGFLLQVEGSRIDHAAHNNDAAALLWDQIAFDDAIQTVLRFAAKHPDTLIVITSDHGNSNPGMNSMSSKYGGTDACFERLALATRSVEAMTPLLGSRAEYTMSFESNSPAANTAAEKIREVVKSSLGFEPSKEHVELIRRSLAGQTGVSVNYGLDKPAGVMGLVAGHHNGIQWTSTSHTSDYTLVTALGPGSDRFQGVVRNTDCFRYMCDFMGSNFRNPTMDLQKAKQFMKAARLTKPHLHWV
jgi:alkaline phosphatase